MPEEQVIDELGLKDAIDDVGIVAVGDDGQLVIEGEFALLITTSDVDALGIVGQGATVPVVVPEDKHRRMSRQRVQDILAAHIAAVNEVLGATRQEKPDSRPRDFRVAMRVTENSDNHAGDVTEILSWTIARIVDPGRHGSTALTAGEDAKEYKGKPQIT